MLCFGQLGLEFGKTERGQDGRATYLNAPKWTDTSMFCHLPDEDDRNAVDI